MRSRLAVFAIVLTTVVGTAAAVKLSPRIGLFFEKAMAPPPIAMPDAVVGQREGIVAEVQAGTDMPDGWLPLRWIAEGRVLADPDEGPGLRYEWPGTALMARFTGDSLRIGFDDPENRFRLIIDGTTAAVITKPGKQTVALSGLGDGEHTLRLERMTEAAAPRRIAGFFVPPGAMALDPPPRPARRIEFFGDSDTVGYGNMHDGRHCPGNNIFLSTDTTEAYPARVAHHFGMRAQVVARSGIGLVRNYGGALPGQTMSALHDRLLPSESPLTAPNRNDAWVTVVEVGANDFATELQPGEAWSDFEALSQDFRVQYTAFLRDLLADNHGAPVIVLQASDAGVDPIEEFAAIAEQLVAEGEPVTLVAFHDLDRDACDWHPSLLDHDRIAAAIIAEIDRLVATGKIEAP